MNVGGGWSAMATGVAQMLAFAVMQAISVTVAGDAIVAGAVYVFELVPEAGEPCWVMVVVAEVNVPVDGVSVQVSPVAAPSFWMDAVKGSFVPPVSGFWAVGGLSEMLVAGMVKFVVAQAVSHTDAQPCTVTFCDGAAINAVSAKTVEAALVVAEREPSPIPLMMEKFASCGFWTPPAQAVPVLATLHVITGVIVDVEPYHKEEVLVRRLIVYE